MVGTIVNAIGIIIGSLIGLIFKNKLNSKVQLGINNALGLGIIIIGLNGVVTNMITIVNNKATSNGELLLVISLAVGALIGEILRIDDKINNFSNKIEKKFKLSNFSNGFVTSSIIFCVGAMGIIGAMNDGLTGDSSVLFIKSTLDFTTSIILSASLGMGVLFSFVPILLYQGTISLLAGVLSTVLQGELLTQICFIGYTIIFAIGINFLFPNKIKTANLLPSLLIPCLYSFFLYLKGLL